MRRLLILLCLCPVVAFAQDEGLPPPELPSKLRVRPLPTLPLQELPTHPDYTREALRDTTRYDQGPHPEFRGPTPEEQASVAAKAERTAVAAIAEYLTRLFVEDSQLSTDARIGWSNAEGLSPAAGVRLQFKTKHLEAEGDLGYFSPAQSGYTVRFTDLIGSRFKVRASVDRSFLELDDGTTASSRFDEHTVGVHLGDQTVLEFEVLLREDETVGSYRDSFRAIVKHQVGKTVYRVGLDRSYNGAPFENGELNAVAGVDLPPLTLRSERHYVELKTSVEVMYGRSDSQAPGIRDTQTLGLSGSLGLEVGANDGRWVLGGGTFREQTFEGLSGAGQQNSVTANGVWLYGSWQVDEQRRLYTNGKYSRLRTQLFGGDQAVQRTQFEFGLETTTAAGNRWRVGLNAGHHDAPGGSGWSTGVTVGFSF